MDTSQFRKSNNIEDGRLPDPTPNRYGETLGERIGDVWRQATSNQSAGALAGDIASKVGYKNKWGTGPDNAPQGSMEEQAGNNSDYWNDPAKKDAEQRPFDDPAFRGSGSGAINTDNAPSNSGSNALDAVQAAMDYGQQKVMGGGQPPATTTDAQPQASASDSQSFEEGGPVLPISPQLPSLGDEHAMDMSRLSTSAAKRAQAAATKRSSGTQSYAEGGAVEDPQEEPQAAPQAQDDAGGSPDPALPVGNQGDATPLPRPPAPANWPQDRAGILPTTSSSDTQGQVNQATNGEQPQQQPQVDPALIQGYLRGDSAASKQTYDAFANRADPRSTMLPDARNIATVQKALEDAGPKAAFGIVQYDRKNWDHEMNLARLALTQGKPADVVRHLNEAYHYMPDGTHIDWSQNEAGGYRAEVEFNTPNRNPVKGIDDKKAAPNYQNVELTTEQIHDWVNIGKAGQFDSVLNKNGPNVLQELAETPGTPLPRQPGPPLSKAPYGSAQRPFAAPPPNQGPAAPPKETYQLTRQQIEERARDMYPMVGDNRKRLEAENAMLQAGQTNETNTTKANNPTGVQVLKNTGGVDIANIKGDFFLQGKNIVEAGKTQHGAQLLEAALAKTQSAHDSKEETDQTNLLREYIKAAPFMPGGIPENVAAQIAARMAKGQQGGQGGAPGAGAAQGSVGSPRPGLNASTGRDNQLTNIRAPSPQTVQAAKPKAVLGPDGQYHPVQ